MWQRLSLRTRLIVLVALALLLGLSGNIARLVLEAGPRVQAEDESVTRLAVDAIRTSVAGLDRAQDPETRLANLLTDMATLRHVSVARVGAPDAAPTAATGGETADTSDVPAWFVAFVRPEQSTVSVPIVVDGRSLGSLAVTSHPTDEIAEIWDGIVVQLKIGLAITAGLLLITAWVVDRALAPLERLTSAMTDLEAGHYETRIAPDGSPELAAICVKFNHLASVLGASVDDKRRLAERMVSLQDVERRDIARDLHDEFGPHLFALRAQASALQRLIGTSDPDAALLRGHCSTLLDKVNDIQQLNRRVLDRLRPVGLAEFGLAGAVDALVRFWRETHPGMVIETAIAPSLGALGDTVELTIYRIIQEAVTNIFRHAGASRIEIDVAPAAASGVAADSVVVSVRDDGAGLPADHKHGFGLVGMKERIQALGGTLAMVSTDQGSTVTAAIPCRAASSPTGTVSTGPSVPDRPPAAAPR